MPVEQKPYVYQEYPKIITTKDHRRVTVNSSVEEDALLGVKLPSAPAPVEVQVEPNKLTSDTEPGPVTAATSPPPSEPPEDEEEPEKASGRARPRRRGR